MEMSTNNSNMSIAEFYNGKSVLVTGGMGFVGKVIVEKLLRSCPGIENIYLLGRSKRGKNVGERLEQLKMSPAFDDVRRMNPNCFDKVILIEGDVSMHELGISKTDQEILKENVSIVLHSAATVNFHETLKVAINTNLRSMRELLKLSHEMKNLRSFVHVSTAYTKWFLLDIKEEILPAKYTPHEIIALNERSSDEEMLKMTPSLVEKYKNTYTFTKDLAENLVLSDGKDLPIAVVRPSLVGASLNEPKIGWIDTISAASVYLYLISIGAYRSTEVSKVIVPCDLIPVDMVANMTIAAAWKADLTKRLNPNEKFPLIYNCSSGDVNPLYYKDFAHWSRDAGRNNPIEKIHWYPQIRMHGSRIADEIDTFFTHLIPAYLVDFAALLTGKKPRAVKTQLTIQRNYNLLRYSSAAPYKFKATNFKNILNVMSEADRQQFNFDPRTIKWKQYIDNYYLGIKMYCLKEKPIASPAAKARLSRLRTANYMISATLVTLSTFLLVKGGQKLKEKNYLPSFTKNSS